MLPAVPPVIIMVVIMVNARLGQLGEQGEVCGVLGRHLLLAEAAIVLRVEGWGTESTSC